MPSVSTKSHVRNTELKLVLKIPQVSPPSKMNDCSPPSQQAKWAFAGRLISRLQIYPQLKFTILQYLSLCLRRTFTLFVPLVLGSPFPIRLPARCLYSRVDGRGPTAQNMRVGLNLVFNPETTLMCNFQEMCDFQEDREATLPPRPTKSDLTITKSPVSRKTAAPSSASSFSSLDHGHFLASEEKPTSTAETIKRASGSLHTCRRKS